jgi:hypothetical protein
VYAPSATPNVLTYMVKSLRLNVTTRLQQKYEQDLKVREEIENKFQKILTRIDMAELR